MATKELKVSAATFDNRINLIEKVLDHMAGKKQKNRAGGFLLSGDPGVGKAQPLYSLIKTPTGWIKMGDIKVGDVVSTPDGGISNVIGVYPQGIKSNYRIYFDDNTYVDSCDEHMWKIRRYDFDNGNKNKIVPIDEILTTNDIIKIINKKSRNRVWVPLLNNLVGMTTDLPLNPYILGAFIGDGGLTSSVRFSSSDEFIINKINNLLVNGYSLVHRGKYDYDLSLNTGSGNTKINEYKEIFTNLGLFGKKSDTKFIPLDYFEASYNDRIELIQGLFDTDGYISKTGAVQYSTTSLQLANDVIKLIQSIGGKARILSSKNKSYTYKEDKLISDKITYTLSIIYQEPDKLFSLPRKVERGINVRKNNNIVIRRRIVKIEKLESVEMQCIMIDHPDHLYITDNYTVTHNTTFINYFARLLGIDVITIEAPHITEEHLVNIPFIVFDSKTNTQRAGSEQLKEKGNTYEIVLADSNLYTQLIRSRKTEDAQYLKNIYAAPKDVQIVFEHFGGDKDTIPEEFQEIREQYEVILFLDEFLRQPTVRIQNMLRNILNNRIGDHKVPPHTYIIYASNTKDTGDSISERGMFQQFKQVEMPAPSKDDWFAWFEYKFENDKHVKLNKKVMDEFKKILDDEDLSTEDENEIRLSPRRWEQLLLYINQSLPVKDKKEAQVLLSNVKLNFHHYQTRQTHEVAQKVLDAVTKLIKTTSKIDVEGSNTLGDNEWREVLQHQIQMKQELQEHRKYIPVLSGPPGIGKTAQAWKVAEELNLLLIDIDVSTLNAEDVVGIPIPDETGGGKKKKISVEFSEPRLFSQIKSRIAEVTEAFIHKLEESDEGKERLAKFKKQKWKYLILFDEFNRTKLNVFNAIRKLILEKTFSAADKNGKPLELPKDAVVMAAINPSDIGAIDMTKHVRDVLDIIPAKADWKNTKEYLKNQISVKDADESIYNLGLKIIDQFVDKFKTSSPEIPMHERPFAINVGNELTMYFSAREYSDLYADICSTLVRRLKEYHKKFGADKETTSEEQEAFHKKVLNALYEVFKDNLNNVFDKHKFDPDEFDQELKVWILQSGEIDLGDDIFFTKVKGGMSVNDIYERYFEGHPTDHLADDNDFINYLNSVDMVEFRHHIIDFIESKIDTKEEIEHYVMELNVPQVIVDKDKQVTTSSRKASKLENFLYEVVYALVLNKFSNDKMSHFVQAADDALINIINRQDERKEWKDEDTRQETVVIDGKKVKRDVTFSPLRRATRIMVAITSHVNDLRKKIVKGDDYFDFEGDPVELDDD